MDTGPQLFRRLISYMIVLNKHGITYDSSIFPIKTPLYDGMSYDCRPFIIGHGIVEIPCSVLKIIKIENTCRRILSETVRQSNELYPS